MQINFDDLRKTIINTLLEKNPELLDNDINDYKKDLVETIASMCTIAIRQYHNTLHPDS